MALFDPSQWTPKQLAAQHFGGVDAAIAQGYSWDATNESWRLGGPLVDYGNVSSGRQLPPGTTFVDIIPGQGEVYLDIPLNPLEQERAASGWAAENAAKVAANEAASKERAALEAQQWENYRTLTTAERIALLQPVDEPVLPPTPPPDIGVDPVSTRPGGGIPFGSLPNTQGAGIWDAFTGAIGGGLTGGIPGAIGGFFGGLGGTSSTGTGSGFAGGSANCAPGYSRNAAGQCVAGGITGTVQRWVPGGQTGTQNDVYGNAVMGRYGAALVPAQATRMQLKCPPGSVLGRDNLCYDHLPNRDRKHPKPRKPLLSANDARILTKAHALENKLNRVAGKYLAPPRVARKKKGRGRARK